MLDEGKLEKNGRGYKLKGGNYRWDY
jgi:hypothetical protein